jgi:RNA polymerase sigma factor (sigma-70 family)
MAMMPTKLREHELPPGYVEADRLARSLTVATALSELPAPQREAIVYVYYLHRTVDQTASVLGISSGTVKARLYYALRTLRSQLTSAAAKSTVVRRLAAESRFPGCRWP